MTFGPRVPEVEHETFARPPLKVMLGQIRFPPVLRIADLGSLGGFQDSIRAEFPSFRQEQQLSFMFGPNGPEAAAAQNAYRFATADGAWSVLLNPEAVTLEADVAVQYTSYDEFIQRFAFVWASVLDHFQPGQVLRQGLRYVDHLEGERPALEWAEHINSELIGPLAGSLGDGIVQSISEHRFIRGDGVLVFKHGILPLGPTANPGYLLDFDYFIEQADPDVSVGAVKDRFDRYHEFLYRFFRWCVTDTALEEFRNADK